MCGVNNVDSNRNVNVTVNVDRSGGCDTTRRAGRGGNPTVDPYGGDRVETNRVRSCRDGGDFETALAKAGSAMKESIDDPLKQGAKIAESISGIANSIMGVVGNLLKGLLGGLLGGGGIGAILGGL